MVIPMPAMPDGPLPPGCEGTVKKLKTSIIAMIFLGGGRAIVSILMGAVSFDFFALLNIFISIVMGTFMLKDDEHLKAFYDCLAKSICQPCAQTGQGGLQCLFPFMIMTLMNVVFDILQRISFVQIMPYGIFLVGSVVAEAVAVYFAWELFQKIRPSPEDSAGFEMSGGGRYGPAGTSDNAPRAGFNEGRAESTQPSGGFQAFQGQGNRLGS
eukprot:gb/GFBE01027721.1/.p1 GENE.gb/GFBE01027721.1/~~gb/GFBE01027721.1/.p1  ORF type:complete len:212 (+),score=46.25 gb/GFBE01027721.1/:1-636(+)